jgi:hypothetical protein
MSQTDPTADNSSELPADDANGQDFGQLGALISRNAGAASVFGEAVEQAGVVVIPVANAAQAEALWCAPWGSSRSETGRHGSSA